MPRDRNRDKAFIHPQINTVGTAAFEGRPTRHHRMDSQCLLYLMNVCVFFKGLLCKTKCPLMVTTRTADNVHICSSWHVRVKLQIHQTSLIQGYCPNMVAQYGRLLASAPALYRNTESYY